MSCPLFVKAKPMSRSEALPPVERGEDWFEWEERPGPELLSTASPNNDIVVRVCYVEKRRPESAPSPATNRYRYRYYIVPITATNFDSRGAHQLSDKPITSCRGRWGSSLKACAGIVGPLQIIATGCALESLRRSPVRMLHPLRPARNLRGGFSDLRG